MKTNEQEVFLTDEQINKMVEDVIRSCYFDNNILKQQMCERMKKRFEPLRRKPEQQNPERILNQVISQCTNQEDKTNE